MWYNGLDLEEWKDSYSKKESNYLHGNCDEWVLGHFQEGDIAVIWNEFNEDIQRVALIHCYIVRDGKYLDIRGETENIEDVEEGFDYWNDNDKYECNSLEEYKRIIREICHYRSKKWK